MDLKNKKVLVLGLGKSGVASLEVLKKLGAEIWVSEIKDGPFFRDLAARLEGKGIKVELGRHSEEFVAGKDLIVVSPGVPSHLSFLKRAKERGIPVIGEIELGYLLSASPIIAVTGTNGKSTVTTLIGKVLEKAGIPNIVCGNIGNPFTGELEKLNRRVYTVLEISSFQLENIVSFRPWIGVVLNITPDHLDRYRSFREYVEAKERIFLNQNSEDYLVLNYGDEVVRKFADKAKSKIIFFNEPGEKKDLTENQKVVLKVCSLMGISEETAFSVFQSFSGLPHRCEFVTEIEGVKFINDSKATNIHSTRYSLTSFREKVILIAGGRDKGQDFTGIREWLRDKVKYLLLIGEGAEKIEKAVGDSLPLGRFTHLEEAVDYAYSIAQKGDIVLLSPMCASFDMFEDYAHRGLVFKEKVLELKKKTEILSGHLVIPAQTVT